MCEWKYRLKDIKWLKKKKEKKEEEEEESE